MTAGRPNGCGACSAASSPPYGEIGDSSAEVYQGYPAQPRDAVPAACRQLSAQLIDGTGAVADEDLPDPAEPAARALAEAIAADPGLRVNAARDPGLAAVRDRGLLEART